MTTRASVVPKKIPKLKKIGFELFKNEENHLVCAGFRRVLLQLHRVSSFSSSEEKTNSVERREATIKIVVNNITTALLVLGQWCLCILADVSLYRIQDRDHTQTDDKCLGLTLIDKFFFEFDIWSTEFMWLIHKNQFLNLKSLFIFSFFSKKNYTFYASSSPFLIFASGNAPNLLPCHALCSTGFFITQQWYTYLVKVDAEKKIGNKTALPSSFLASGASAFSSLLSRLQTQHTGVFITQQ